MGSKSHGASVAAPAPNYVDPVSGKAFNSQDALNAEIDQRKQAEQATSDAATATTNAQKAADEAAFQAKLTAARSNAQDSVNQYFTNEGYDPNAYKSQIDNALNTAQNHVSDLAPDPQSAFSSTTGADILTGLLTGAQDKAVSKVNQTFAPNWANTALPDTLIDPAVTSVVGSQFTPLGDQLSNAQKRGTLNDQGYAAALQALTADQGKATSAVSRLADNVLTSDRGGVNNYIDNARTAASKVDLNTAPAFDPGTYLSGASSLAGRYTQNFTGDVQNAVGSTSFADLPTLLNAGGVVQGANDPTATNPNGATGPGGAAIGGGGVSPTYIADQVLQGQKRGLGTAGAF